MALCEDKSGLVPKLIGHVHPGDSSAGALVHRHELEKAHTRAYLAKHPTLYDDLRLNLSAAWAEDQLHPERHHGISEQDRARKEKCVGWMHQYDVQVETGWGEEQNIQRRLGRGGECASG